MLRRLASLGHQAADDQEPMSPSPGDDSHSHEAKAPGGLAGVFKGLAGSKLTKSPPPTSQPPTPISISQPFPDRLDAVSVSPAPSPSPALRGIPPEQMELFGRLRQGSINERIAAASSLRYAIADYPISPIRTVWHAGKDLIDPAKPKAARVAGWELLTECAKCTPATDLERSEYFRTLAAPAHREDFHLQLTAIEHLTNHGRNVGGFYHEIFPLLTLWLHDSYKAVKSARRHASRAGSKSTKGKALSTGEDKNFSQLFAFVKDVIKFNFKHASDAIIGNLMDILLRICMNTSVEDDLRSCINVIDALVTFGAIPNGKLKDCMQVLGSIHCLVPNLQKDSWHTISDICKSHHGQSTMRLLLDVLRNFPIAAAKEKNKEAVREVRGALSVLKKLLSKSTEKGYPAIPLALLLDGLTNICISTSTRVASDILKLINSLFDGPGGNVNSLLLDEHWTPIFSIAVRCAEKGAPRDRSDADASSIRTISTSNEDLGNEDSTTNQARILVARVEKLVIQDQTDSVQREECMHFLTQMRGSLPNSTARLVLDHFKDHRSCLPSQVDWRENINLVLEEFYLDQDRPPVVRLRALEIITDAFKFLSLVPDMIGEEDTGGLVDQILAGMGAEHDTLVLHNAVAFLVDAADTATTEVFDRILDAFKSVVTGDVERARLAYALTPKPSPSHGTDQRNHVPNQSLSNVVARGYVQMFIRWMNQDASKSTKVFHALVRIASSSACEIDARLTAMKILFRVRADSDYHIYLTTVVENEGLAASLYRTEASLARKQAEDAAQPHRLSRPDHSVASRASRGISFTQGQVGDRSVPSRHNHTPKPAVHQGQRLWSLPDPDALPEEPPREPSPFLVSCKETGEESMSPERPKTVLNISYWFKALQNLFHEGCDWEIYSYVLVHLPSQLSNQPIFENESTQIQEFRRVLCEMIRMSSFQEPPSSSGLRRPDVANCLFHSLGMILSYRRHFQKMDEDEMVRTFIAGITDKTAKTCIHALSVCCHELPQSVSKALVTILQKMSMVITQPLVAMHILEFLACLSRLPSLYSNFREEEYRIVFGICFRYLQYVRDRKHSVRNSQASEPSTPNLAGGSHPDLPGHQSLADDLPQYVYALAYHVITFWFLAVKMPDRPNLIGWIAKNLFTDVDGTASNEEQAQVTLDFMQRVAYSDASDSAEDPLFREQFFGDVHRKRWIIGNSVVTIKQSKETGWAEITRRYPSGTSSFAVRVEFAPLPAPQAPEGSDSALWNGRFQQGVTIAPSHLLMQLVCPMPQIYDPALRPIPLPDEDAVERAIRLFDRNSTVDGHKVGVIYIGEGQTRETEILANTIGSPAYHRFLAELGVLTTLKGATFNTQGLDRENDIDGQYTYCWRDRVTEIVFHVTTQMPTNLEHDAQCVMKKRHIGNDFVNIVFNDSGLPFNFDTFPSQFNYVYIVITPTPNRPPVSLRETCGARPEEGGGVTSWSPPFFMVQVMSQPGFPEISPASEPKIVSLRSLPTFVRLLALNASVFSHVWANREGGEHVGSWRNRLREVNRLRERYGPKLHPSPPPSSLGGGNHFNVNPAGGSSSSAGPGGSSFMGQVQGNDSSLSSRPVSSVRDSFVSLRRSSVATFFTNTSADQASSHRSSMLSNATTEGTEVMQLNGADALVDSVDFSKWS